MSDRKYATPTPEQRRVHSQSVDAKRRNQRLIDKREAALTEQARETQRQLREAFYARQGRAA